MARPSSIRCRTGKSRWLKPSVIAFDPGITSDDPLPTLPRHSRRAASPDRSGTRSDCDPAQPRGERRSRAQMLEPELRTVQYHHALCRRRARGLRRPRLSLGLLDRAPAPAVSGRLRHGRTYRNWSTLFNGVSGTTDAYRDRQPEVTPADFELLLHHGADRSETPGRRRIPGVRAVRRGARQVRPRQQPREAALGVRRSFARIRLLQRQHQRASGHGAAIRRRNRLGPDGDRQMLRGRFAAATSWHRRVETPFSAQTQAKLYATYSLPRGVT